MTRQTIRFLSAALMLCLFAAVAGAVTEAEADAKKAEADVQKGKAETSYPAAALKRDGCLAQLQDVTTRYYDGYDTLYYFCTEQQWSDLNTALYAAWNYGSVGDISFGYATDFKADGKNYYDGGATELAAKEWAAAHAAFEIARADYAGADYHAKDADSYYGTAASWAGDAKKVLDLYVP